MKPVGLLAGRILYRITYPLIAAYINKDARTRVIVRNGNKLLVVKSWLGSGSWDLPGGGLHKGEDPADGAARELHEETGLTIPAQDLGAISAEPFVDNKIRYTAHYMITEIDGPEPGLMLQRFEIAEARWVSEADLSNLDIHINHKKHMQAVLRH